MPLARRKLRRPLACGSSFILLNVPEGGMFKHRQSQASRMQTAEWGRVYLEVAVRKNVIDLVKL